MDNEALNSNFTASNDSSDPTFVPGPISDSTPLPTDPLLPKPKNLKPLVIILSILFVVALVVAAVFAYLYFSSDSTPAPNPETHQTDENKTEETSPEEETEITDAYIIRDLDEKIAILHNITETGAQFATNTYLYRHINSLYTEGTLGDIAKLSNIINSIRPDYVLSYNEQVSIANELGLANPAETYVTKGVKSETVKAKYLDVFGGEPAKSFSADQFYCPNPHYNAEYDFYYLDERCGGTGPFIAHVYKNKYTADSNHAYVYVSVATLNGDGKVYCDYITDSDNLPAACGEISDSDKFVINGGNYQDYAEYRFVFNRADNGTYYFTKVEKL